jgi:fructoselysine-6-P-deglycase FrlB-like protein
MGEEAPAMQEDVTGGSRTEQEVASQPACWRRAGQLAADVAGVLPAPGERVAVAGCGTSWFMAQSYAAAREASGHGETDAFAASEMPVGRAYDRVVVLSRSGTTTEIVQLLDRLRGTAPTVAITAVPGTPVAQAADAVIDLGFADEESVVQTRFATTELALLRANLGVDPGPAADAAERVLAAPLPVEMLAARQFTFLGTGWTYGLANEAALKLREAAGMWTEAYPAMEYRHGPVAVTGEGSIVWLFGARAGRAGRRDRRGRRHGLVQRRGPAGRAGPRAAGGCGAGPGPRAGPGPAAEPGPLRHPRYGLRRRFT